MHLQINRKSGQTTSEINGQSFPAQAIRVLVADADPEVRETVSKAVALAGGIPLLSATARQTRQLFMEHQPALVLLATDLPDQSGYELCHEWREQIVASRLQLVLLAATDSFVQRVNGFRAGAAEVLSKPLEVETVSAKLRELMDTASQSRMAAAAAMLRPLRCVGVANEETDPSPVKPTAPPIRTLCESVPSVQSGKDSILLADDSMQVRRVLNVILSQEGFTVSSAEDGGQALELFRTLHPRLVILDYFMPVRNGFQVLQEIRRVATPNEVPVIILTGKGLEADIEEAFRIGANDYILKPFSTRELIARIKACLAISRSVGHP